MRARLAARARLAETGLTDDVPVLIDPWRDVGNLLPDTIAFERSRYRAAVRDANSVLNLNRADESQIRNLLLALHIDARDADRIAQAVLDWRDADDFRRANGAERTEYLEEHLPFLPRNGSFAGIEEVRHVLGINGEIFTRIRPHIGIQGSGRINLNAANEPVLSAVPGLSDEAVAVIVRQRARGGAFRNPQELLAQLSPEARQRLQAQLARFLSIAVFETREVEITSEGWIEGSPVRVDATAVLVRSSGGTIVTWRSTE